MLKRLILCLLAAVLVTGLAYAHGDPIVGTVKTISGDTLTITDKDNKPVKIMLVKTTKYLKSEKPATKADLKVGVRVVIDAEMDAKMKMYSAEEVEIGVAAPAAPAKPAVPAAPAAPKK